MIKGVFMSFTAPNETTDDNTHNSNTKIIDLDEDSNPVTDVTFSSKKKSSVENKNTRKPVKEISDNDEEENDEDEDEDIESDRSEDEGSVGSLEDFIVDDKAVARDIREAKLKRKRDPLEGIDTTNIVPGKRQRKAVNRYMDKDFWKLMTADVDEEDMDKLVTEIEEEDLKTPSTESIGSDEDIDEKELEEDEDEDDDEEEDDENELTPSEYSDEYSDDDDDYEEDQEEDDDYDDTN